MDSPDYNGKQKATDDVFFKERLEMLYQQALGDLRAFAEREDIPFEEVRRRMAELHSKFLFGGEAPVVMESPKERISRVLQSVSQELESLETLAGIQSFFLVVNPHDQDDQGFLGGTVIGREFWRGHRGCGAPGAEAFKAHCMRVLPQLPHPPNSAADAVRLNAQSNVSRKKGPAMGVKTELYAGVRDALRLASGVRNAEMKWTNHSKLAVYGVQLNGWPVGVPVQNPSTLTVAQNKLLLDSLCDGKLHFSRLDGAPVADANTKEDDMLPDHDDDAIFEDSIDYAWASGETEGIGHQAGYAQVSTQQADSTHSSPPPMDPADEPGGMSPGDNADNITTSKRRRVEE